MVAVEDCVKMLADRVGGTPSDWRLVDAGGLSLDPHGRPSFMREFQYAKNRLLVVQVFSGVDDYEIESYRPRPDPSAPPPRGDVSVDGGVMALSGDAAQDFLKGLCGAIEKREAGGDANPDYTDVAADLQKTLLAGVAPKKPSAEEFERMTAEELRRKLAEAREEIARLKGVIEEMSSGIAKAAGQVADLQDEFDEFCRGEGEDSQ